MLVQPDFKREPIRSRKLLDSARGQPCSLEFVGVCSHDPETTVSAHIHDQTFGLGMKADDFDTVHACDRCHMFLDHGWVGKISQALLLRHIIRAMQRTTRNRIERGLIFIPVDAAPRTRATKPRKPKADRAPIRGRSELQSRPFPQQHRPLKSANTLRRPATRPLNRKSEPAS